MFLFLGYTFQTIGLQYTTVSKNAFITATYVVVVPLLYWLYYKKRPRALQFVAVIITLTGVRLLTSSINGTINIGDFLTLLSAVAFAFHMIYLGKYLKNNSPLVLTAIQLLIASILSFICMGLFEPLPTLSLSGIVAVVYLGIFSSCIAFSLQNIGQKYISEITASIILSFESVFGTLFAVLIFKETLGLTMIIGAILILISTLLAEINITAFKKRINKKTTISI